MRKYIILIMVCALALSCANEDKSILTAEVPEAWEEKPVVLYTIDTGEAVAVDSTVVRSGHFTFSTRFDKPRHCQVRIFLDPENRGDRTLTNIFNVFLDSTMVTVRCDMSQEQPAFTLSGGDTQTLANEYEEQLKKHTDRYASLFKKYQRSWYADENVSEGASLAAQIDSVALQTTEYKMEFIKRNPSSVVSLSIISDLVDNSSRMTGDMLQQAYGMLSQQLRSSDAGRYTSAQLSAKHVFTGAECPAFNGVGTDGREHSLPEMLNKNGYTLVELWASWCAPCRGDLPFLRKVYEQYKSKGFNIISISVDTDATAWQKAVDEEKMSWTQLRDSHRKCTESFESSSVPTALLISPDGVICLMNARGGWLLNKLHEIYDK